MAYAIKDFLSGVLSKADLLEYSSLFDDEPTRAALHRFLQADAARSAALEQVMLASAAQSRAAAAPSDDTIEDLGGNAWQPVRKRPAAAIISTSSSSSSSSPAASSPSALVQPKKVLVGFPQFRSPPPYELADSS
jgi:hypothetical protein